MAILDQFADFIRDSSMRYNVPEVWIRGVIMTESSGNPTAYRAEPRINSGSYGLMQLLPSTAVGLGYTGDDEGLFDPQTNIDLGTKLLGQLRNRFGDDVQAVYSAYNSGGGSNYLTNPSVAAHVQNFLNNLQNAIQSEPLIAATGSFGVIAALLFFWYFTKKKGK